MRRVISEGKRIEAVIETTHILDMRHLHHAGNVQCKQGELVLACTETCVSTLARKTTHEVIISLLVPSNIFLIFYKIV